MAKERRTQDKAVPRTMEEWRTNFREQYRPEMVELVGVFDNMPRRPDEEEWRAALVEELLDLLWAGVAADSEAPQSDMAAIEQRLFATLQAVGARVHRAIDERGAAGTPG